MLILSILLNIQLLLRLVSILLESDSSPETPAELNQNLVPNSDEAASSYSRSIRFTYGAQSDLTF